MHSRAVARWGLGPPQYLADQLTLSWPGGKHYPHPVLLAPPEFQTLRRPCIAQPSPHSQRTDLIAVVRNRTYYFLSGSYSDQIVLFLFYLFVRFVPCLNGMTFLPETESWFPPAFSQDIFGPFKFEKIKKITFRRMKENKNKCGLSEKISSHL